jgi:hypothetical protein
VQEREALTGQITTKPSHASDVFFRSVQATDNASFYGVGAEGEYDWNGFCRCLGCKRRGTSAGGRDDRDVKVINKVRRQHRQSILLPLGPAEGDVHIAPSL